MQSVLKREDGVTLIELLVAMIIGAILVGAAYRTFILQQKTYTIQENAVDMQQNASSSMVRMAREIRMAGFGGIARLLPIQVGTVAVANIINADTPVAGALSILEAGDQGATLASAAARPETQIVVSTLADEQGNAFFDTGSKKYVSIDGLESHEIASIDTTTNTITLKDQLLYNHAINAPVFPIKMITYRVVTQDGIPSLMRDENRGLGGQPEGDNIEAIQFEYLDAAGDPILPANARMIRISVIARAAQPDPDLKGGDGYRRRRLSTVVQMKDMIIDQQGGGV